METLVANLKPKVGAVYGYGWDIMKKYLLPLFLLLLITSVVGAPAGMLNNQSAFDAHQFQNVEGWKVIMDNHHFQYSAGSVLLKIFGMAYLLFIMNPIGYGAKYVRLRAVRNQNFDVKEVFSVFKNYLNVVLSALLASSIVVIGLIFLIVPGIVFACRLAFVPYLVMDKNLDPVKAVEESWRLTKGYGWKIFWMAILAFFIGLAGFLCLFVGLIFSIIWVGVAFAAMYQAVVQEKMEYAKIKAEVEKTE
jgi:uncharacterized membrane protein